MIVTKRFALVRATSLACSSAAHRPTLRMLRDHCATIVARSGMAYSIVRLDLEVEGICPATHENAVLRVIDELFSNALEHGFYGRQRGRVFVHVVTREAVGVAVSVSDDGWGFADGDIVDGNGFHLLRSIGKLRLGAPAGPFPAWGAVTVEIAIPPSPEDRPR
jgi:two-component sensor histidine kinase